MKPGQKSTGHFAFLKIPLEIRNEIYYYIVVSELDGQVQCRDDGVPNASQAVYCWLDLPLTRVSRQVREEALIVFYTYNSFTLLASTYKQAQQPRQRTPFALNIARVHNLHIIANYVKEKSPYLELVNCYRRTIHVFRLLARNLQSNHQLRNLYIEAIVIERYDFLQTKLQGSINESERDSQLMLLDPLRTIQVYGNVHIRAYNPNIQPYLRELESQMCRSAYHYNQHPSDSLTNSPYNNTNDPDEQASIEKTPPKVTIVKQLAYTEQEVRKEGKRMKRRFRTFAWRLSNKMGNYDSWTLVWDRDLGSAIVKVRPSEKTLGLCS